MRDDKKTAEKSAAEEIRNEKRGKRLSDIGKSLRSVRFTVWIYFAIFITSILVLIWVSFIVSLEATYRTKKTSDIASLANYILTEWADQGFTENTLDRLAHDNEMCVLLQDKYGLTLYSYDVMERNCMLHGYMNFGELSEYRRLAIDSEKGIYYAEITNTRFDTNTLLFAMVIGDKNDPGGYLFLNTSLEPLESTVSILRVQMFQVTLSMMVLGFGISIFLSRLISTPLIRITKSAEKLAQGDYNVKFNGKGYTETEKLADTLNYASKEITKIDTMRRDLMANISHDLRTPLTMVKAYAEMVRDLSGDDPEKRNEHLGIIIEESDRLAALVNDIMDLTKLESGAAPLSPELFCVGDRLREIMTRYTLLSERDGYNFYVSVNEDVWAEADLIKFDQVIYNLVNNAVNYSGEEKSIYVMQTATDKTVEISVTDTGSGISPELLPLIFDRYYRAEKHKREVIGTGLGLSIVKQIFILHGFQFGVRSEEGVGSTFWFEMERKKINN
ncbi:MAG: HAMP domain-containing histidine kinase [Oscillospiraceae bacterium]|nr:HAMP domain-containing histidine kinase [Oscillospiraceae bacterium]